MKSFFEKSVSKSNLFSKCFLKLYFWLVDIYIRHINKVCGKHRSVIFFNAYLFASNKFPHKKLSECMDYASTATSYFFNLNDVSDVDYQKTPEVYEIINFIKESSNLRKVVSDFHQIKVYLAKTIQFNDSYFELIKRHENYANKIYDSPEKINNKNIGKIKKRIAKELKNIIREAKSSTREKVELEGLKVFEPIRLKSQHVTFSISLFSSLFILSGYLYNKLLFSMLNISVDDFFNISDYISTSTSIITTTAWSLLVGGAVFFHTLRRQVSLATHNEQFENEESKDRSNINLLVIALLAALITGVEYFYLKKVEPGFFIIIFMIMAIYLYIKIPSWKYIKNDIAFRIFGLAIITSIAQVSDKAIEKALEVKSFDYRGAYSLQLSPEFKQNHHNEFFAANSEFVFLWDTVNQNAKVIPKKFVIEYVAQ